MAKLPMPKYAHENGLRAARLHESIVAKQREFWASPLSHSKRATDGSDANCDARSPTLHGFARCILTHPTMSEGLSQLVLTFQSMSSERSEAMNYLIKLCDRLGILRSEIDYHCSGRRWS